MPYPSKPPPSGPVSDCQPAAGLPPQVLVLCALDHSEQRLVRPVRALDGEPVVLVEAALRPRVRARHRPLLVGAGVHQRGELVEREDDVGAQLVLNLHRHLGREPVPRPVEVRLEGHPVVVDVREALLALGDDVVGAHAHRLHREHLLEPHPQRHHLEPAAVGEGRAVPVHERAEPAGLVDDVRARPQIEVVGIREQRLRPVLAHRLRQHRLDRRLGADRHERRRADLPVRGADRPGAAVPAVEPGADGEVEPAHQASTAAPTNWLLYSR